MHKVSPKTKRRGGPWIDESSTIFEKRGGKDLDEVFYFTHYFVSLTYISVESFSQPGSKIELMRLSLSFGIHWS